VISGKASSEPIRAWSAGCATGEEAYTLAIVLAEALGADAFQRRVQIYATDVDEDALVQARAGTYSEQALEAVPADLRERYFERRTGSASFRGDARRPLVFGRHDLLRDAPISHLDLLVCRNTLMYFDAGAQAALLDRFRSALEGGGHLFLGRSETPLAHSNTFRTLDFGHRLFEAGRPGPRERSGISRSTAPAAEPDRPRFELSSGASCGVRSTFDDVTHVGELDELEHSIRELRTVYEELQSTAEQLATTNEELRSTNEELRSANEQLASTNEDLRSTNEELRLVNEMLDARDPGATTESVSAVGRRTPGSSQRFRNGSTSF
jgi:hypothetical protein